MKGYLSAAGLPLPSDRTTDLRRKTLYFLPPARPPARNLPNHRQKPVSATKAASDSHKPTRRKTKTRPFQDWSRQTSQARLPKDRKRDEKQGGKRGFDGAGKSIAKNRDRSVHVRRRYRSDGSRCFVRTRKGLPAFYPPSDKTEMLERGYLKNRNHPISPTARDE
ncbi:hypothetical protein ACLOJK_008550 [Asimina triloba]